MRVHCQLKAACRRPQVIREVFLMMYVHMIVVVTVMVVAIGPLLLVQNNITVFTDLIILVPGILLETIIITTFPLMMGLICILVLKGNRLEPLFAYM